MHNATHYLLMHLQSIDKHTHENDINSEVYKISLMTADETAEIVRINKRKERNREPFKYLQEVQRTLSKH